MKKAGNELMAVVGGREIHPINVRVGGFYRAPTRASCSRCVEPLERAREAALETVALDGDAAVPGPRARPRARRAAPSAASTRSTAAGSSPTGGLDIAPREFDEHFEEEHVAHSNALHARLRGRGAYLAGPLARFNLNFDALSPVGARGGARGRARRRRAATRSRASSSAASRSLYAFDEALRLIDAYEPPDRPGGRGRAARRRSGYGATEAPRGLLYHRYEIDDDGTILDARIVPPTSQNQLAIEEDLRALRRSSTSTCADDELRHALRAGDPQLRPVHLLRHPLPDARRRAR